MKRNYLLVYHEIITDTIKYEYFETEEDMNNFINHIYSAKTEVLHKYQIKEVK